MWENIILIAVLTAIVVLAAGYIIRAKKRGKKCIGCPVSGCCGKSACGSCPSLKAAQPTKNDTPSLG